MTWSGQNGVRGAQPQISLETAIVKTHDKFNEYITHWRNSSFVFKFKPYDTLAHYPPLFRANNYVINKITKLLTSACFYKKHNCKRR